VHGFKYYEVRLRQSQRRPYVIARRLFKGTAMMALAIVLFAIIGPGSSKRLGRAPRGRKAVRRCFSPRESHDDV
jgi:hypothetical protein